MKYNNHPINYQLNPRNKLINKDIINNILNENNIYDKIKSLKYYQISLTQKSYIINNNFGKTLSPTKSWN